MRIQNNFAAGVSSLESNNAAGTPTAGTFNLARGDATPITPKTPRL